MSKPEGTAVSDVSPGAVEFPFPLVSRESEEMLEEYHSRARQDYEQWKRQFLEWLHREGKKPHELKGYSKATIRQTHYKTEHIFQWLWGNEGYTLQLEPDDATEFMKFLGRFTDKSGSDKLNYVKTIKRIFSFFNQQKGRDFEWEKPYPLSEEGVTNRAYFKRHELSKLYEASLNHGGVKHYHSCDESERDTIKGHLARRFDKKKSEIGPEDFDRANSFKIPSLIAAANDCALRPIEITRAKVDWVNLEAGRLEIEGAAAKKSDENWAPALQDKSVRALELWLDERESMDKYDGRDELWLNKQGNPYNSKSLNYLLGKLIEEAEIEENGRNLTFYSIRHGVATIWAGDENITDAMPQLRHTHVETTQGYSQTDSEDRRKMANKKW